MSVETQLAVIEQELDQVHTVVERLDKAIEKITDVTTDIGKILAVHDQRLEQDEQASTVLFELLEKRRNEMDQDIKELHSRITTTTRELSEEIAGVRHCITSSIDDLKKELKEDHIIYTDRQRYLEKRIETLEKWRYMLVGAGIVGGFILTHLLKFIEISVK